MTDIHIGFDPDAEPEELNRTRFRAVLERILSSPNLPDLMVISGDLTDHGDAESFARTAELLSACPFPLLPMVGNHDTREELLRAFPLTMAEDDFVHYAVDREGLRLLCLDTFEAGRHGGAYCEARAEWLRGKLDEAPDMAAVIFMHHPPIVAGIGWMDPDAGEAWIARFAEALAGHEHRILAIHCGHLHRPLATRFRGIPLSITPSVAPLVALDLRDIDPKQADGRALITTEPPGYALHLWDGTNLVTHYETVGDWQVLASYGENLKPMIQDMFAER